MTILELANVQKIFYTKTQQTVAVENLSFEVKKGEFVALVGPSGCGKTTILSLIAGLIAPTKGEIRLHQNSLGYMLQRDQLFPFRTIRKNILLGLEVQKKMTPENVEGAYDLLRKYGLWDYVNSYPNALSGGMRQRVALIRTLATNPQLLLLDEPFSALDFQTRLAVCDDVYDIIKKEHKTALLVTHDISEAISMADRVIVLTKRPAKVLAVWESNLRDVPTPLGRRESPKFGAAFELLHGYLKGGTS